MPLRNDLLGPIAGPDPGGSDLLEDPAFLRIKEARREEADLPQGDWEHKRKVADPALVIRLAEEILAKRSKDLWVAAWLVEGLLRSQGFTGLSDGLNLLSAMLERLWDHLYPRLGGDDAEVRAAPLSWVGQYLDPAVKAVPLNKDGHGLIQYRAARALGTEAEAEGNAERQEARAQAIAAGKLVLEQFDKSFAATPKPFYKGLVAQLADCLSALATLDALSQRKFGDDAPNYRGLREALLEVQEVAQELLARKLEVDPDPPEPEPAFGQAAAGPAAVSIEPTSASDAAMRIAAAAHYLQRHDPVNPAPYLLLRGYRWGELRARGGGGGGGGGERGGELDPRLLAAPPTEVRTRLKSLLLDGRWPELLEQCEMVMATPFGRGWLDLQRYVLTACFRLGSEYEGVAVAILAALTALLRDLPQLPELTMMDDTPTANEETRAWLRESGILDSAAAGAELRLVPGGAALPGEPLPRPSQQAYDQAMAEVRAGRPEKGVEVLMRTLEQERSERARFLRRSEMAGIMVEAGYEQVALPVLRELVAQIEAHRLEEWEEGELVARTLGLLYRCIDATGAESEDLKRELYLRICRLDPVQAISFQAPRPRPADGAPRDG